MRWNFFHGVFGTWGWEKIDDMGTVIAESREFFESREEAERDAAAHGFGSTPVVTPAPNPIAAPGPASTLPTTVAPASEPVTGQKRRVR